ncbi:MAG: GGDEF domain-containing protein [Myxococcaceae bacterium]|nr:GGDEF domain-containing protein [Myxococcaceae bacterium]MCI0673220.1 GGDEF domain-containing protein [Myxococcaceae bacterium]
MTLRAPYVDVATGAYVRAHFLGLLSDAVSAAHRDESPLCVLYVDLDETAVLKGDWGQEAVEAALASLCMALSTAVDGLGPIGRMEDDAFAVLLVGCTLAHAARVAQAIRREASTRQVTTAEGTFHFTASVGVACLRRAEPWGNLFEAAEDACTRAKQGGRNRVVQR